MPPDPQDSPGRPDLSAERGAEAGTAVGTRPVGAMADGVHRTLAYRAGSPDARPGAGTIRRAVRAGSPASGAQTVDATVDRVLARMTGLGPLEPLLTDPAVTDVMVNGPGRVWLERDGTLVPTGVVLDRPTIEHLIERVVGPLGLRADRATPMVDARMPDGSRVHVVMPPIAVDGPCVTIRRFATRPRALAEMCPPAVAFLLGWAVRNRLNMMVSGGTGAGKTTLLNALAAEIPTTERIVTVEEAAELRLAHHHVVRLEARPSTPEAGPPVTIRDLVRNALRMRPDRIIVGECRGPEALEVLVAANSGHEGTLSTCHANSPIDALRRLETMVLLAGIDLPLPAVRDQIVAALDLVVQVARRSDGTRRVVAVAEVTGAAGIDAEVAGRRPASSCRLLADDSGVHSVPQRPVRAAETEPLDTAWVTP